MSKKKNLRRLSVLITAQTMGNLEKLADMEGCGSTGRVIDKLVRDRMLALRLGCKWEGGGRRSVSRLYFCIPSAGPSSTRRGPKAAAWK